MNSILTEKPHWNCHVTYIIVVLCHLWNVTTQKKALHPFKMKSDCHKQCLLLVLTCPMGGAPIGGIMGGIIPGGMGAMLGGLWPMGGIPIGGKWGGIPGGPIFGKHKNKFEAWMSANTTKQPQRERWHYSKGFPTPTYKGWGDSWRWYTRKRWCLTGATISISRGLLWTRESITVTTTALIKMLHITDLKSDDVFPSLMTEPTNTSKLMWTFSIRCFLNRSL